MNVLVVAVWMRRGHTYLALQAVQALERAGHAVHILARPGRIGSTPVFDDRGELALDPDRATRATAYIIPPQDFRALLGRHRFDVIVFVEEQWQRNLSWTAQHAGIPTVNIVMWEFFDPADTVYSSFNVLVFPTRCGARRAHRCGYNAVHVPWGVDLDVWQAPPGALPARIPPGSVVSAAQTSSTRNGEPGVIRFIHSSGWGGGHKRKQTDFVIDAFKRVRRSNARLLVHRQTLDDGVSRRDIADNIELLEGNLDRHEVAALYRDAHCAIAPSKWEGLGYSLLEPQAAGVPVVSVDSPPMNECIQHGVNGLLARVHHYERFPGVAVRGAIADPADVVLGVESLVDEPVRLYELGANASRFIAEHGDWRQNASTFVTLVERVAAEPPACGVRTSRAIARVLAD